MGHRIFRDSRGTEWQAWDVVPRPEERRVNGYDRRARAVAPLFKDRRMRIERRILIGHRSVLTSGLDRGWLCFEANAGKRRLSPIPGDWLRCPNAQLEQYCARATPARGMSNIMSGSDIDPVRDPAEPMPRRPT